LPLLCWKLSDANSKPSLLQEMQNSLARMRNYDDSKTRSQKPGPVSTSRSGNGWTPNASRSPPLRPRKRETPFLPICRRGQKR
jgi:hypothetical protein